MHAKGLEREVEPCSAGTHGRPALLVKEPSDGAFERLYPFTLGEVP